MGKNDPSRDLMWKNGYPQVYYVFLSNMVKQGLQDMVRGSALLVISEPPLRGHAPAFLPRFYHDAVPPMIPATCDDTVEM